MTDARPDHLLSNMLPEDAAGHDIDQATAALEARRSEILASFSDDRLVVTDNATVGTTADKIAIAQTLLDDVDAARRRIKGPFDRAVKTVDGRAARFAEPLEQAIAKGERRIREFRARAREESAKALQAQRDEEARLAAQAGLTTATAPAAPVTAADVVLPTARGDYGSKVHDKRQKTFKVTDVRKLPDEILMAPAVEKAILAAIKQLARLREKIPGVEIGTAAGDNIRRAG